VFFFLSPVALQSLTDPGRLTYRRFLYLFRHMVGLLGRVISPSQGLYLHRTTQHRKTRTNIHALSGIRTHYPSNQPAKTHASERTVTVTGHCDRHDVCSLLYIFPAFLTGNFIFSFRIWFSNVIPFKPLYNPAINDRPSLDKGQPCLWNF
jgi:hypothetical protein